jgi:hypothetical protein
VTAQLPLVEHLAQRRGVQHPSQHRRPQLAHLNRR